MPELPEVETIRRTLAGHVTGKRIIDIDLLWPGAVRGWQEHNFRDIVKGRQIEEIERRAKYLLIRLDQGWTLIAHMRMTGRLLYFLQATPPERHTHLIMTLDHGHLHFADQRKFGRILAIPTKEIPIWPSLAILGPEPLAAEFTVDVLAERLTGKKTNLKAKLLDQTVLAGLGNIYADESMFRAGLLPERPANSLTSEEMRRLHQAIQAVLRAGIESMGTSFRDYRDANGEKGSFQEFLQVYGRGDQPCRRCGQHLEKQKIAGRTTVFCRHCQH